MAWSQAVTAEGMDLAGPKKNKGQFHKGNCPLLLPHQRTVRHTAGSYGLCMAG